MKASDIFRIHGWSKDNIRGDIYGGLTAAVVALPLAMAFGVASGAGPIAGLYGAIFVGLFASLFGGTPSQVSGPTGPMTVVMTGVLVKLTAADPVTGPAMAFTVVMLGGLIQIAFGALRFGKYINLVPYPVISGFMTGIGVIIILLQMSPLFGHASSGNPMLAVRDLPDAIAALNAYALGLGVLTIGIVYLLPNRVNRIIPAPLFALIAGTITVLLALPSGAVSIIGDIPSSLPMPQWPRMDLAHLAMMIKYAMILAVLGSIDSLLTSLVADSITRTQHDSDRELIGQGIGNALAGVFGGLPGAGATMRTVVNVRAGGRTPISGAVHAVALLAIVLGAGAFAKFIPHVVLAGILIKVGTDIIDWDFLRRSRQAPKTDVAIMLVVVFITVFVDLITSVAVGIIISSLLLAHKMARIQQENITPVQDALDNSPLCEEAMAILRASKGRILVYHLSGPLSFGGAKDMVRRMAKITDYDAVVLDLSDVTSVDYTSCVAIEDMVRHAQATNHHVFISGIGPQFRQLLEQMGVLGLMRPGHEHGHRLDAIRSAQEHLKYPLPGNKDSSKA